VSDMAGKAAKGSGRAWRGATEIQWSEWDERHGRLSREVAGRALREQPRYNSKVTAVVSDETVAGVCARLWWTAFDAIPAQAHPELWSLAHPALAPAA
jgi:hypothetical protein